MQTTITGDYTMLMQECYSGPQSLNSRIGVGTWRSSQVFSISQHTSPNLILCINSFKSYAITGVVPTQLKVSINSLISWITNYNLKPIKYYTINPQITLDHTIPKFYQKLSYHKISKIYLEKILPKISNDRKYYNNKNGHYKSKYKL